MTSQTESNSVDTEIPDDLFLNQESTTIVIDVNEDSDLYELDDDEMCDMEVFVDEDNYLNAGRHGRTNQHLQYTTVTSHEDDDSVRCTLCRHYCNSTDEFMGHIQTHHPLVITETGFRCPFCKYNAKARLSVEQHLRIHSNDKPFKCGICGKRFNQKSGVKQHMRSHSTAKPFPCHLCSSRFKAASTLACHISMKHDQNKPFQCKVCSASFGHSSNLTIHMRTHTGERPYKCTVCEKSFVQQGHLITHQRLHTGEKPFKCEFCISAFTHIGNLRQHVITQHTKDYKHRCKLCSKGFIGPSDLKRHMMKFHPGVLEGEVVQDDSSEYVIVQGEFSPQELSDEIENVGENTTEVVSATNDEENEGSGEHQIGINSDTLATEIVKSEQVIKIEHEETNL